jgi:hypothetical protein
MIDVVLAESVSDLNMAVVLVSTTAAIAVAVYEPLLIAEPALVLT